MIYRQTIVNFSFDRKLSFDSEEVVKYSFTKKLHIRYKMKDSVRKPCFSKLM